ncbi:MAG: glycosyltransferase family 39 protein [Chloroflexota bacterium]
MMQWIKRNAVEITIVLLVLISHTFVSLADPNTVLNWYHVDDAFYYFKTAQNISEGRGVTFDGLGPTNGFHPLWLIVCIPVFSLARYDLILPLRLLILIQGLFNIGTGILLYRMSRRILSHETAVFISFFWLLIPQIYATVMVGGLESGINAFFIVFLWFRLSSLPSTNELMTNLRQVGELGLLAALAILSRLDNAFIAVAVGVWLLYLYWSPVRNEEHRSKSHWLWRIKVGFVYSLPVIILVGAYLLWNLVYIGHLLPISSEVKQWWGTLRNTPYGVPPTSFRGFISEAFVNGDVGTGPWSFFFGPFLNIRDLLEKHGLQNLIRLRWLILVSIPLIYFWRKLIFSATRRLALIPLFLACLGQITYYKLSGHVAQREWYWVIELIFIVLVLGLLIEGVKGFIQKIPRLGPVTVRILLSASLIYLAYIHFDFVTHRFSFQGNYEGHFYLDRANWVKNNTEPDAKIAITGSGNLGYFTPERTIINLDGLISNYDYLQHIQNGMGAEYLTSVGVDYVMGGGWILKMSPYKDTLAGHVEEVKKYKHDVEGVNQILWRFVLMSKAGQDK